MTDLLAPPWPYTSPYRDRLPWIAAAIAGCPNCATSTAGTLPCRTHDLDLDWVWERITDDERHHAESLLIEAAEARAAAHDPMDAKCVDCGRLARHGHAVCQRCEAGL